ncbi:methanol/ethanol family PQQ-dependent dehydrogenase [Azohydromonas caseinilytica]|uniref:Methanol/ethanol family PQQ-dependent dehydrogenase n=1 Tax=Azohydromonas caseinilytica TaxID=2728836 RepID=A0A848F4E3_9BURK|nr:methanol/ethanol family PQQ-dependent dehydrogenase [Azohydromonas caseinilytica]NML13948.1 methanol/ethanol family PQQ-dependent dehydrogenase [Azohydromonas caseinilytica]
MVRAGVLLCVALLQGASVLAAAPPSPPAAASAPAPAEHEAEGEWPMAARDHANTRFSPLSDITPANVARLQPVLERPTGAERGHEAAPLVVGATLLVVTPYPNELIALDLSRPGFPEKWRYKPHPDAAAQGVACCDVVNRGAAYADGRVFFNTLDGQAIAVELETGREIWRTKLADIRRGETITMAPLVVRGKVLIGNSGGEYGVRGWLVALDAASGKEAWRAWSTGPDKDVLIGPAFKPFYPQDRGPDLGERSWSGQAWKQGGGNVWGWVSYDPKLDLLYYGTANPGPWNPEQRPGSNHWTSGVFARRPDTGEAVWFYQWSPHDLHDYDGVNENVLVDLPIGGAQPRPVLLHPDRNGYLYVLDRATGQVLSADPFAAVTTSLGVDLKTGALRYEPSKEPRTGRVMRDICPPSPGAKDWQPSAWSPRTRLLYIPHQNMCQDAVTYATSYIAGTPYVGADVRMKPGPGGHRGELSAWDPVARKEAWTIKENFPVWSGALATAGDVVFYGTMDGWFKAVDARSGKELWKHKTPSGIIGQPVSFRGPDGRQYVAVLSGVGGWAGAIVSGDLDPRDGTAAKGFVNAMRDLPQATRKGGAIHVFALPK